MDEWARRIVETAFDTLDRTRHIAPNPSSFEPSPVDDSSAYPTGVDRVAWRQEQERQARQDAQREAAKLKAQPDLKDRIKAVLAEVLDETPFTERQEQIIGEAVAKNFVTIDTFKKALEKISNLCTEVATLRESKVTILPPSKGKKPGDAA